MKNESMVGRRLYAWMIDALILFVLVFVFDWLVSTPLMNNVTEILEVKAEYIKLAKDYEVIQDEYGIYYYDSENNRIYNNEVTEEVKNKFLTDQRILDLNDRLVEKQNYIILNFVIKIAISLFLASIIIYIIIPLSLSKGRTLGKLAAKLYVVNDDSSYAKWYKILIRYILNIIFNVYLALASLGIIPLISLIISINQKQNKALPDLICKTIVVDSRFH
jgi:uncharacterized RDD family membrane protein YckC